MVAVLEAFAIQLPPGAGCRIAVCVPLALPHPKRKEAWIDLTPCCSYPRSNISLSQEKRKLQHAFSYAAFLLEQDSSCTAESFAEADVDILLPSFSP